MWHGTDERQHGQGRGAPMPGQAGRGIAMAMAMGIGMPYGPMPVQGLAWGIGYPQPAPPAFPITRMPTFGRGAQRPNLPLGVQGPGVLKRFGTPSQGPANRGRGYNRGYGGHGSGGQGHKLLTKEALDADLDQWRMKDKRSIGQFLDADLDEYWQKKDEESTETKSVVMHASVGTLGGMGRKIQLNHKKEAVETQ